ncbi:hypothetical protein L596_021189 [Steinernema carpocapsae]|uniref:7TM GPCR serpentine receptor class x (Srx) domain-containing protein n=1 Tax=Steinernema carpocapsae TaxID=34508 RepID=A0A4U5MVS2_STECR|nr:hypothetical protein L596_021189 [Steinernema carpocapsae]
MLIANTALMGTIATFLWSVQHAAAGFVYMGMNGSVHQSVNRFLIKIIVKETAPKKVFVITLRANSNSQ